MDDLAGKVANLEVAFHWTDGGRRFWFAPRGPNADTVVWVDSETGRQSNAAPPPPDASRSACGDQVISPSGKSAAIVRGFDLWMRDCVDGKETRLTHDGEEGFAYGELEAGYDRQQVARRRAGLPPPLKGVLWSADSRFLLVLRQDLRRTPQRLFITEYLAPQGPDRTYVHANWRRMSLPGDTPFPVGILAVIDTRSGQVTRVRLDPDSFNDLAFHYLVEGVVWWSEAGQAVHLICANHGGTRFALHRVDVVTGETRRIVEETARFNVRLNPYDYARPNVHVSSDGREIIWYSERSGYGHLYLYDADGNLQRPLTCGEWVIFDLLRVDEVDRLIYFTAASRDPRANPYYRYLYRLSLDGGEPQLLTPEAADHGFANTFFWGSLRHAGDGIEPVPSGSSLSPCGRYFVDGYSTTDQPPQYVLRRSSGELVATVLSSDVSDLRASGWSPPERVCCKAADGHTDLYGVITRPRDFDPSRKYPVIDFMYPGPQGSWAPRSLVDQLVGFPISGLQTFADAGFVVVAIDGRGTAHRSREFRDAFLGTDDVFGAADHVAAVRGLAETRSYMDLDRVGVIGQSFGGYGSLRALLLFPELFKVAVSATGPCGYLDAEGQTNVERFFGVPSESSSARRHYERISNAPLIPNMKGHVLLIYGGIDESVPLKHAFELFAAFKAADKDPDVLIAPDLAHPVLKDPYVLRRSVQYFQRHLGRHAGA